MPRLRFSGTFHKQAHALVIVMHAIPAVLFGLGGSILVAARTGRHGLALVGCLGTSCPNPVVIACLAHEKAKLFPIADTPLPRDGNLLIGAEDFGRFGGRRRGLVGGTAGFAAMCPGMDLGGSNNLPLPLDDSLDGLFTATLWVILHIITDKDLLFTFPGFDLDRSAVFTYSGGFGDKYIFHAIVLLSVLGSLEEHSVGESSSTTFVL